MYCFRIGFVYDERMLEHKCDWDNHPEQPDRIRIPRERCLYYGLIEKCSIVPVRVTFLFWAFSYFFTAHEIKSVWWSFIILFVIELVKLSMYIRPQVVIVKILQTLFTSSISFAGKRS